DHMLHFSSLLCSSTAPSPPELATLSLHDALPISAATAPDPPPAMRAPRRARPSGAPCRAAGSRPGSRAAPPAACRGSRPARAARSEEHTSELQSLAYLVCRLLLEKKKLTPHLVLL